MANMLKRLALVGITAPLGIGTYWALTGTGLDRQSARLAIASPLGIGSGGASSGEHDLRRLSILEYDLYMIKSRYVEKERLDANAMFDGALDAVEREVSEVMFVRTSNGDKVHISAGAFSTILPLEPIADLDDLYSELSRVARILDEHLSQEISRAEVEYAIINGALSTLDPHSVLLPPVAAEEMDVDNQGEFGGLGVEISSRDGRLLVKVPMPDTPASKAGLKPDDHIIRIEGESTINMDLDEAVNRLRGEVGAAVNIEIMRAGLAKPISFNIVRAVIRINPVEGELLEGNVGYVRIKAFHANVASDLSDLLARFGRESSGDVRGLILDLRSNPGGYLNQAIKVCDIFLKDGVIVTTVEGGDRRYEPNHASDSGEEPDYPITVLVNASSASASEIVAGALRNQHRAVIIGERSFGKGSVQHLYDHRTDHSRLKLTVAQYLTPGEKSIQSVGIPPDIYLQPSIVRPARPEVTDGEPIISLYWRDWVSREGDLDHHLDHASAQQGDSATYQLRYLRPRRADDSGGDLEPSADWEVLLAREIVLASPSYRRTDMLTSAGPIIERYRSEEADNIQSAFEDLGIDWSTGPNEEISLDIQMGLGEDGVLSVGTPEVMTLSVTNTGEQPIHQLSAFTDADSPALDQREFYFGHIAAGETRSFSQQVTLPVGYGDEISPLTLTFRDPQEPELLVTSEPIRVEGRQLPQLSYQLRLIDDGSGQSSGDGDGIPEVGETIDAELTVTNIGAGPTGEAYARLKNHSGRSLDLQNGIIEIGSPLTLSGEPCTLEQDGCQLRLPAGETHTGRFTFELPTNAEDGEWAVEILVGDNQAYDYAAISQGGFYEYFQLTEKFSFSADEPFALPERRAPLIEVTRKPDLLVVEPEVVISGVVRDDRDVRDVIIFHDAEKIFFRGGVEGGMELPFSVEQTLDGGVNSIYILARDFQGLTTTYAIRTWLDSSAESGSVVSRYREEGTE
jgi:carboxyl-terminal processing protease